MSYLKLANNDSIFRTLYNLDVGFSEQCRSSRCPHCQGPLHKAYYQRKPRGETCIIPENYRYRLGLCCGWCRRRILPPSCLFFGRRVFWGFIVILVSSILFGPHFRAIRRLCRRFDISRRTLGRWRRYFKQDFPQTQQWQYLRGRIRADSTNDSLPRSLLKAFLTSETQGTDAMQRCLSFLARGTASGQIFRVIEGG